MFWSGFSEVVGVAFWFGIPFLGFGESCFLVVDLPLGGVGVCGGVLGLGIWQG